ncbi:hypothetical protein BC829DRAFT_393164, partial [Chytridium lagenaria]
MSMGIPSIPATSSGRIQLLYPLPLEVRRRIFLFAGDLDLSVAAESLLTNLPSLYPATRHCFAFEHINFKEVKRFFPVSKELLKSIRYTDGDWLEKGRVVWKKVVAHTTTSLAAAWMYRFGPCPWNDACFQEVALRGCLDLFQMLYEYNPKRFSNFTKTQCAVHHLNLVRYLHEKEGFNEKLMDLAATYRYLDVVMFLHKNCPKGRKTRALYWAAARDTCILMLNGCDEGAVYGSQLHIVKYLLEENVEACTEGRISTASKEAARQPFTTDAMDVAAAFGHLNIFQFLHDNRREGCTFNALAWAAENSHGDVVEFLAKHRNEGRLDEVFKKAVIRNRRNVHASALKISAEKRGSISSHRFKITKYLMTLCGKR